MAATRTTPNPGALTDPVQADVANYLKAMGFYKCPADLSTVKVPGGQTVPGLRSLSMGQQWAGPGDWWTLPGPA